MCMQTDKYIRALNQVRKEDLDNHVAALENGQVTFTAAQNPPSRWSRFRGAIDTALSMTTTAQQGDTDTATPYQDFVTKFRNDMRKDFGDMITANCFEIFFADTSKPLKAREVKLIIESAQAEKEMACGKLDTTPLTKTPKQLKNDRVIRKFLSSDRPRNSIKERMKNNTLSELAREKNKWFLTRNDYEIRSEEIEDNENSLSEVLRYSKLSTQDKKPQPEAAPLLNMIAAQCEACDEYSHGDLSQETLENAAWQGFLLYSHLFFRQQSVRGKDEIEGCGTPIDPAIKYPDSEKHRAFIEALSTIGSETAALSSLENLAKAQSKSPIAVSKPFLKNAVNLFLNTHIRHLRPATLSQIDRLPLNEIPRFAKDWEEAFFQQLLSRRKKILTDLDYANNLTAFQKQRVLDALDHAEYNIYSFLPCLHAICAQFTRLAAPDPQQQSVVDAVKAISESVTAFEERVADHDHYLATLLDIGAAGLQPSAARALLERLEKNAPKTIQTPDGPKIQKTHAALIAVLRQRGDKTNSVFQHAFRRTLNEYEIRITPDRIDWPVKGDLISPVLIKQIANSTIELSGSGGKPLIDIEEMKIAPELIFQSDDVSKGLRRIIADYTADGSLKEVLIARLSDKLAAMDAIVMNALSAAYFTDGASDTLFFPDGTPRTILLGDLRIEDKKARIFTVNSVGEGIRFIYQCTVTGMNQTFDEDQPEFTRRLDPTRSRLLIEADLTLSISGVTTLNTPVSFKTDFHPVGDDDQSPQTKPDRVPTAGDLLGKLSPKPVKLLQDLLAFAQKEGKDEAVIIIQALKDIHAFSIETASQEQLRLAAAIYEKCIKTLKLDFLSSNMVLADILEKLYPHLDGEDIVHENLSRTDIPRALERLLDQLNSAFDPNPNDGPGPHNTRSFITTSRGTTGNMPQSWLLREQIVGLKDRFSASDTTITEKDLEDLKNLIRQLTAPEGGLAYRPEVFAPAIAELKEALVIEPLSPFLFDKLAEELAKHLEKNLLPAFIEQARAQNPT